MKRLVSAAVAAICLASGAQAAIADWGFKMVPPLTDGDKVYSWTGGGITVSNTQDQLKIEITGLAAFSGSLDSWLADFGADMSSWLTTDLYINHGPSGCTVLATPIVQNWDYTTFKGRIGWDQATGSSGGFCQWGSTDDVVITANIASMPLPAGAVLLLTGFAGLALTRRRAG